MKIINIFLISTILLLIHSNIWDNIYSQAKSPHFLLPENFQILVTNEKDNSTVGELFVSSSLKLIKFSFILDESNVKDAFIHLLVDFNQGKIYFDTEEKCVYQYYDMIEQLSPKFFLYSYDLLSYFSEDEKYYHYIVINPLSLAEVDEEPSFLNKLLRYFVSDLNSYIAETFETKTIYEKPFYGDFIIDKESLKLLSLTVKTGNSLNNFKTNFDAYDVEKEKFNGIHNFTECTEYKS